MPSVNVLIPAIVANDAERVKELIGIDRTLLDRLITQGGQTPLIYALELGCFDVFEALLKLGADITLVDSSGLTAMVYAVSESGKEAFIECLNQYSPKSVAPIRLIEMVSADCKIALSKVKTFMSKLGTLKHSMLLLQQALLTAYSESSSEIDPSEVIDVFFTAKSLLKLTELTDLSEIHAGFQKIINQRANVLKGTYLDDCYHDGPMHQCLIKLISILYGEDDVQLNRIFFDDALKGAGNVLKPWKQAQAVLDADKTDEELDDVVYHDAQSSTEAFSPDGPDLLPKEKTSFMRDQNNLIHDPHLIVQNAMKRLAEDKIDPKAIWLVTDERLGVMPLEDDILNVLAARSASFRVLYEYINDRHAEQLSKGFVRHFYELRDGLERGDKSHAGSHLFAGDDALIAQAKFVDWWNELKQKNHLLFQRISDYSYLSEFGTRFTLSDILNPLIDPRGDADRSNSIFCVETIGKHLDSLLKDNDVKRAMQSEQKFEYLALSDTERQSYEENICRELSVAEHSPLTGVLSNPFSSASTLIPWLVKYENENKHIDYYHLLNQFLHGELTSRGRLEGLVESFLNPPVLLEQDNEPSIDLIRKKEFDTLLLFKLIQSELGEGYLFHCGHKQLKKAILMLRSQKITINPDYIMRSFELAKNSGDVDWIGYLVKEKLYQSDEPFEVMDSRYPVLQEGQKVQIPRQHAIVNDDYEVIVRSGNKLILSLVHEGPDEDIELSLLNDEEMTRVSVYHRGRVQPVPLRGKHVKDANLTTFSILKENLTLFNYLIDNTTLQPDWQCMIDDVSGGFVSSRFAREVILSLVKRKHVDLSQELLQIFLKAAVSGKYYELIKPLLQLGLSPDSTVNIEPSYDIKKIKVGSVYNCFYSGDGGGWYRSKVTALDIRHNVTRIQVVPVDLRIQQEKGIVPVWHNITHDSNLAGFQIPTSRKMLHPWGKTQQNTLFNFAFSSDKRDIWTYMIKAKLDRDDSVLNKVSWDKTEQYIECLTSAGLVLNKTSFLLMFNDAFESRPPRISLIDKLALNEPSMVASLLCERFTDEEIVSLAFDYRSPVLISLSLDNHLPINSVFFDGLSINNEGFKSLIDGLNKNNEFYKDDLTIESHKMLMMYAIKNNSLELLSYFIDNMFEVSYDEVSPSTPEKAGVNPDKFSQLMILMSDEHLSLKEMKRALAFFKDQFKLMQAYIPFNIESMSKAMSEALKARAASLDSKQLPVKLRRLNTITLIVNSALTHGTSVDQALMDDLIEFSDVSYPGLVALPVYVSIAKLAFTHDMLSSLKPLMLRVEDIEQFIHQSKTFLLTKPIKWKEVSEYISLFQDWKKDCPPLMGLMDELFVMADKESNFQQMQYLYEQGCDLNLRLPNGDSFLSRSLFESDHKKIEFYLTHGADRSDDILLNEGCSILACCTYLKTLESRGETIKTELVNDLLCDYQKSHAFKAMSRGFVGDFLTLLLDLAEPELRASQLDDVLRHFYNGEHNVLKGGEIELLYNLVKQGARLSDDDILDAIQHNADLVLEYGKALEQLNVAPVFSYRVLNVFAQYAMSQNKSEWLEPLIDFGLSKDFSALMQHGRTTPPKTSQPISLTKWAFESEQPRVFERCVASSTVPEQINLLGKAIEKGRDNPEGVKVYIDSLVEQHVPIVTELHKIQSNYELLRVLLKHDATQLDFLQQFRKVYDALYHSKTLGFFKTSHRWDKHKLDLDALLKACKDRPSSRSANALKITVEQYQGFHVEAKKKDQLALFNGIYKMSLKQSWFSVSKLPHEPTFEQVGLYASEKTHSRTATICKNLVWSSPTK